MLPRIIFCTAVSLAVLTVVLLALFSPVAHRKPSKHHTRPWLALSLYIQQPLIPTHHRRPVLQSDSGAFIFHRTLTKGPQNTSMVVGQAQGFILLWWEEQVLSPLLVVLLLLQRQLSSHQMRMPLTA